MFFKYSSTLKYIFKLFLKKKIGSNVVYKSLPPKLPLKLNNLYQKMFIPYFFLYLEYLYDYISVIEI